MGPELLTAESLLDVYRDLLSWLGILMTWMGGLLVALSALGAILYLGLLWQHLDRHLAAQARVLAEVNLSHAALTERFKDLVMTEGFADQDDGFLPGSVRR